MSACRISQFAIETIETPLEASRSKPSEQIAFLANSPPIWPNGSSVLCLQICTLSRVYCASELSALTQCRQCYYRLLSPVINRIISCLIRSVAHLEVTGPRELANETRATHFVVDSDSVLARSADRVLFVRSQSAIPCRSGCLVHFNVHRVPNELTMGN